MDPRRVDCLGFFFMASDALICFSHKSVADYYPSATESQGSHARQLALSCDAIVLFERTAETLKLTGETVCASLNGTELCLALSKTSDQSFRASVTGLDFAYCDFTERVRTPDTVPRPEPSEPLSLDPPRNEAVHYAPPSTR